MRRLRSVLSIRQIGLVDDRIRVYRIGKIYLLPRWGQAGMMVAFDGRIIGVFVVPD